MITNRVILTYKEYEALPTDGRRYELHDGELSVTPAPSPKHQRVSRNLFLILHNYVKDREIGEVLYAPLDCILSDTTVVQPDIVYLERSRLSAISSRGIEGPPTLVVEVLSPSTTVIDRSTKLQLYGRHGVPYYWIVDPDARTIESYTLSDAGYQLAKRAAGRDTTALPPFFEFAFTPDTIWP
jgi:Uma2 family endonuclease